MELGKKGSADEDEKTKTQRGRRGGGKGVVWLSKPVTEQMRNEGFVEM